MLHSVDARSKSSPITAQVEGQCLAVLLVAALQCKDDHATLTQQCNTVITCCNRSSGTPTTQEGWQLPVWPTDTIQHSPLIRFPTTFGNVSTTPSLNTNRSSLRTATSPPRVAKSTGVHLEPMVGCGVHEQLCVAWGGGCSQGHGSATRSRSGLHGTNSLGLGLASVANGHDPAQTQQSAGDRQAAQQ
jgi:hypothetical protein